MTLSVDSQFEVRHMITGLLDNVLTDASITQLLTSPRGIAIFTAGERGHWDMLM